MRDTAQLDLRRLRAAYEAVRRNRGEPGVDGVTVEAFGEHLEANLAALVVELRVKTYRPQPVRRVLIPNPDGGQRPLGIPAGRDRMVQQAVLQVLEPIFEAQFSSHSHGFRPGHNTFSALRELYSQVRGGHVHIVDVDIEKFFGEIPHEPLLDAVAERVADGSVLRLVRLFLEGIVSRFPGGWGASQGRRRGRDQEVRSACGRVTVPGLVSAARVAWSRYAFGSTPQSFADSMRL